jgi:hypothetical protein
MAVTAYHSVQKGVDRKAFTELLTHVAYFIKDIDKYKNSIGLLVTKVENKTKKNKNSKLLEYIADQNIFNQIGEFLKEVKNELELKPASDIISKQIELINIFTTKDEKNEYSKIGILRRPTDVGDLNLDEKMTTNRNHIKNIIDNALQSKRAAPIDFGLSLSADSKYIVTKMQETLNTKLSNILDDFIRVYSQKPVNFASNHIERMKTAVSRTVAVANHLKSAIGPNLKVKNLMKFIHIAYPDNIARKSYDDWRKQQKYVEFLESIAPATGNIDEYRTKIVEFKEKISNNVELMKVNAETTIDQAINEVISQIMMTVKNSTASIMASSQRSYTKLSDQIHDTYNSCDRFKTNNQNKPNLSFKVFLNAFKAKFNSSGNMAQKLESYQTDIEFFKSKVNATFTDGHQEKWLKGFAVQLNEIKKVVDWYSFITDSYTKLIEYDSQHVIANNRRNLKNWINFKLVRKELGTNKAQDSYLETLETLSEREQTDLNKLIDEVQPSINHSCESSKLIVKGNLVKLSTVKTKVFQSCASFTDLFIFASQLVIIDESLIEPSKNVYIIAPTWRVKGTRLINLRGLDANPIGRTMAGDPGQPGGNFIGVGDNFVNGNDLTIDVSGGNGGKGKDGDNGRNGVDGKTPRLTPTSSWHDLFSRDYCTTPLDHDEIAGYAHDRGDIYKMFGTKGEQGTRGDNGGKHGYGAKSGYLFTNSPEINKLANSGVNGENGKGGKGGIGGEHGKTRFLECHREEQLLMFQFRHSYTDIRLEGTGRAENGDDGISGVVGTPALAAEPRSFTPISTVAEQYKQFIYQKASHFADSEDFINRFMSSRRKRSVTAFRTFGDIDWTPKTLAIDHKSGNLGTKSWTSEFSLSSFVALADVFLRKVMKTKATNIESQEDPTWENLLIQAEVLKIVENCEKKWDKLNRQQPFNSLCLQKELNSRLKQLEDNSQVQQIEVETMEHFFTNVQ